MTALYNEIDPKAAAWLRELIRQGHIAPGIVDERSIEDLDPEYLRQFTQVHFFAGIGVWSYALRRAGWRDDEPVWTGSCPCQPFSAAGKGGGFDDERHLWPAFHWLIEQCRPDVVLGEQVASKDGLAWFDLVSSDLEASGYAAGASDTCAAGFGAPHIRQRLYWCAVKGLADAHSSDKFGDVGSSRERVRPKDERRGRHVETHGDLPPNWMAHADGGLPSDGLADAEGDGHKRPGELSEPAGRYGSAHGCDADRPGPTNGHWRAADWLGCRDGKWRPVEPGTFPLAHGAAARVGRLRGYGNAIVAPQAQAFVEAVREWRAASDLC
jgi:DNA (cytosine-5)-methyltransferase 1